MGGSGGWGESYHHIGVGGTNNDDLLRKCKIIEEEMEKKPRNKIRTNYTFYVENPMWIEVYIYIEREKLRPQICLSLQYFLDKSIQAIISLKFLLD